MPENGIFLAFFHLIAQDLPSNSQKHSQRPADLKHLRISSAAKHLAELIPFDRRGFVNYPARVRNVRPSQLRGRRISRTQQALLKTKSPCNFQPIQNLRVGTRIGQNR